MLNLTPFLRFWRDLNIALVCQGEPEADHREARQAFAIRLDVEGIEPDALA